jgi:hypothetical protein
VTKILKDVVVPKSIKKSIVFIMGQPLEQAVAYLTTSLQAIRSGDYPRAGAFASAALLVAGRYYAKRPEESIKVAALADSFLSYAVARENVPQAAAAAMTAGFGAPRTNALAYAMRKHRYGMPVRGVQSQPQMGKLARTMALVKMLEAV